MYQNGAFKVPNKPVANYRDSEVLKKLLKAADDVCPGLKRYTIPVLITDGWAVHLIIDGATDEQCNTIGNRVDPNYSNYDDDSPYRIADVCPLWCDNPSNLTPC